MKGYRRNRALTFKKTPLLKRPLKSSVRFFLFAHSWAKRRDLSPVQFLELSQRYYASPGCVW